MLSNLARVTESRDQFATIGTKLKDKDMVSIALNGLDPFWNLLSEVFMLVGTFVRSIL
jgi:hypothetical protein